MYLKIILNKMNSGKDVPAVDVVSDCVTKEKSEIDKEKKDSDLTKKTYSGNKRKPVYNLDDNIIKVVRADNDVHFKLLTNNKGVFVDIRRYNRGFPTQKGVRIYASVFKKVAEILKDDIFSIVPNDDLNLNKCEKIISI